MTTKHPRSRISYLRVLLGLTLVVGILLFGKAVIVPLSLSILLAFVLNPVVAVVQRTGLGRVPAVLLIVVLTFMIFGGVGWGVGLQVNTLARDLPDNKGRIEKKLADLRGTGAGAFPRLFRMFREIEQRSQKADAGGGARATETPPVVVTRAEEPSSVEKLARYVSPVLEPLATAGLITILTVFMLVTREDLRNRFIGLMGEHRLAGTTRVLVDSAERLSTFLLNQFLVNVSFGIVFGLGLLAIGVPYAFVWAFLTAVLRFIPYVGTWISAAFPLILSFAVSDGWAQPVIVLVFFATLDLVTANVLEPLLFGHSTGVSPIALLVAAAFWTWVWGPIGLLLSTPLTVCLVVLGQHVPDLKALAVLLGDRPALKPHLSYYQRILAKDPVEAFDVVAAHARSHGADHVYDDVLLPALALARRDRLAGDLTTEEEGFFLTATRGILDKIDGATKKASELNEKSPEANGQATLVASAEVAVPTIMVLGAPAHHEGEELSLQMLAALLKPQGCQFEVLSTRTLPAEVEARVAAEAPKAVFIAVLPPGGYEQARYLCRRLRKQFADLPIIVGYWGHAKNFDRLLVRLRSAGASYLATSMLQSASQIRVLIPPSQEASPASGPALEPAARI